MRFVTVIILSVITGSTYGQATEPDTLVQINRADTVKYAPQGTTAASFPGGRNGLLRYLGSNLDVRVAPADGDYKATVKFMVGTDGKISEVEIVETSTGCAKCDREAARVVRRMPKWKPATKNGEPVPYQATQSITFRNTGTRF